MHLLWNSNFKNVGDNIVNHGPLDSRGAFG